MLCTGKLYYSLLEAREERFGASQERVALVRVEQLYPWPEARIVEAIQGFERADRVVWAQEEPANMGAWTFVRERLQGLLRPHQKLAYAGRPASASPAAGSLRVHRDQQEALIAVAFDGLD